MVEAEKKTVKWMGVQTLELFRREVAALFDPIIQEIRDDKSDSRDQIEDKAWELLGTEAYRAHKRKKELEKEMADVEEILRKYNGGACSYRGSDSYYGQNYSYANKRNRTQIEDKIWAAEQILFPELDELEEMKKSAVKEVTFCGDPSELKKLLGQVEKDLAKVQKSYKAKRIGS